jgi:xanthine dehydrogenase YagT iron-sulfur-binding subunit
MKIKNSLKANLNGNLCNQALPHSGAVAPELLWECFSRRDFLVTSGTVIAGVAAAGVLSEYSIAPARDVALAKNMVQAERMQVQLNINGQARTVNIEPNVTLLDLLRERLGLTGTKKGCDHGQCGACTVLIDGRRINSCLALAVMHEGAEIVTVEGLAQGETLHPVQGAFIEHDGFQCGYCTSGQICSAVALIREAREGKLSAASQHITDTQSAIELTDDEIRERMSGNICRCGAYNGIVAAVREAWEKMPA